MGFASLRFRLAGFKWVWATPTSDVFVHHLRQSFNDTPNTYSSKRSGSATSSFTTTLHSSFCFRHSETGHSCQRENRPNEKDRMSGTLTLMLSLLSVLLEPWAQPPSLSYILSLYFDLNTPRAGWQRRSKSSGVTIPCFSGEYGFRATR